MIDQSLLTASDCARRYCVTRSEWYRMVSKQEAPRPTIALPKKLWSIEALIEWEEVVLSSCDETQMAVSS